MGTWVLILTLYNGGVTSIPGFSSGVTCAEAGNMWIKNNYRPENYKPVAVCVQVK